MKASETASNNTRAVSKNNKRQSHGARFTKVFDGRKQPIRGLWERNGRFLRPTTFGDAATGKKQTRCVPLVDNDSAPVHSAAATKRALEKLRTQREANDLPVLKRTPKFSEFVQTYLAHVRAGTDHSEALDGTAWRLAAR